MTECNTKTAIKSLRKLHGSHEKAIGCHPTSGFDTTSSDTEEPASDTPPDGVDTRSPVKQEDMAEKHDIPKAGYWLALATKT